MRSDELFAYGNVAIRQFVFRYLQRLFVTVRFAQIFAFERARERNFPFRSAADWADLALYGRAVAAGAALAADFAQYRFRHRLWLLSNQSRCRVRRMLRITLLLSAFPFPEACAHAVSR